MCSPAAMGAAAGGGQIGNVIESYGNWKAQRDARGLEARLTASSAKQDLFTGWADLQVRRAQNLQQTTEQVQQIANRAALMSSSAVVGAAEAGVGGASLSRMLQEYQRTSLIEQDRRLIQQDFFDRQISEEAQHMRSQAQNRIYGTVTPGIPSFDWFGAIQGIFGAGAQGYSGAGGKFFSSQVPSATPSSSGAGAPPPPSQAPGAGELGIDTSLLFV